VDNFVQGYIYVLQRDLSEIMNTGSTILGKFLTNTSKYIVDLSERQMTE